jgi:hypothetical protein
MTISSYALELKPEFKDSSRLSSDGSTNTSLPKLENTSVLEILLLKNP